MNDKHKRRRPTLTLDHVRELKKLMEAVNGDVHDLVGLLAALRGQMALMKDVLRLALDELARIDDAHPERQDDEKLPPG